MQLVGTYIFCSQHIAVSMLVSTFIPLQIGCRQTEGDLKVGSMTRLVVTPPPLPTESLPGYVLHLTAANHYPGSKFILASMRKRKDQSSLGRIDSSPLMHLAGINRGQAARLSMQCVGEKQPRIDWIGRTSHFTASD